MNKAEIILFKFMRNEYEIMNPAVLTLNHTDWIPSNVS